MRDKNKTISEKDVLVTNGLAMKIDINNDGNIHLTELKSVYQLSVKQQ